jgi:phosphopantothenoylcysteine decarboxylase/phosphopantothenate--cysteine ligase
MKIALGVCGGIAAYKAAELVRLLQDRGVRVQVIMTRSAQEFVRPLTFAALSGEKVITGMFADANAGDDANLSSAIEHIAVAQDIDALVVTPATANVIAKFARGIADDFLTTLYLATKAPVVIAAAMNVNMWEHPATQENLDILRRRGVHIVEPGSGYLACGMVGAGRLAEPATIADEVMRVLGSVPESSSVPPDARDSKPRNFETSKRQQCDLADETILVTAGPTREPIDPVRYISNRSSGKMGYAIAEAATARGARVILVSGPVALPPPKEAEVVRVETAEQMRHAVMERAREATVVIKAAAVGDYRAKHTADRKIKRNGADMTLELAANPDIVAELAARRTNPRQVIIGFAAETDNTIENARRKLVSKGLDAVVLNDVSQPGIGFDSERNAVTILTPTGQTEIAETAKTEVAERVLDLIGTLRAAHTQTASAKS